MYAEAAGPSVNRMLLRIDPRFCPAHGTLVFIHYVAGDLNRAVHSMRAAVECSSETPLQRCFFAWSLAAAGEMREATEMLSDFMHLRKMNCLPATSIALIDAALGDTKAAWKWLDLAGGSSIPGNLASQRIRDSSVFGTMPDSRVCCARSV